VGGNEEIVGADHFAPVLQICTYLGIVGRGASSGSNPTLSANVQYLSKQLTDLVSREAFFVPTQSHP
jgi:hypothetical protein